MISGSGTRIYGYVQDYQSLWGLIELDQKSGNRDNPVETLQATSLQYL
ncbi:MAG: hypothetical protein F6J86_07375 [Symploca sp. SIO1B1]|nr:hypothetical protein [Symploca sp. SIO1B1]